MWRQEKIKAYIDTRAIAHDQKNLLALGLRYTLYVHRRYSLVVAPSHFKVCVVNIKTLNGLFVRYDVKDTAPASIWFLHGFADSGAVYTEVFHSKLAATYNLYVVDFPGFGVSPLDIRHTSIKAQASLLVDSILAETGDEHPVIIVAHSIGALIGTWVCKQLGRRIGYYFNIEGNLTVADSYFSSQPLAFPTAEAFFVSFEKHIFELAKTEEKYKRYYSSLRLGIPEGMRNWAITSQAHVKNNLCGFEFLSLACNKVYIWGDVDTSVETQAFIHHYQIPNRFYKGIGHWHMTENTQKLYDDIHKMLEETIVDGQWPMTNGSWAMVDSVCECDCVLWGWLERICKVLGVGKRHREV